MFEGVKVVAVCCRSLYAQVMEVLSFYIFGLYCVLPVCVVLSVMIFNVMLCYVVDVYNEICVWFSALVCLRN